MKDPKLEEVYFYVIERTMRTAKQLSNKLFSANGFPITVDQWVILKRIHDDEGLSQAEISEHTFKDPAAITRIVDQLQKKGMAERVQDPNDRRRFNLILTTLGQKTYSEILPEVQRQRALGVEGISTEELEAMKLTLNKIYKNLS